jgi:hypothetical protein
MTLAVTGFVATVPKACSRPEGKTLRRTPYMPYLSYAPSAWVLPLKFTGGGLSAPGKIMFDATRTAMPGQV